MSNSETAGYPEALNAFHRALDEWNWAGEPQSGVLFERMLTARERLLSAIHIAQARDVREKA